MVAVGYDIDLDSEQVLDVEIEPGKVEQAAIWGNVDEHVEVRLGRGLSSSRRPEDANVGHPVPASDLVDLRLHRPNPLEQAHLLVHDLSFAQIRARGCAFEDRRLVMPGATSAPDARLTALLVPR
jgi:hypothetical protein